MWKEQIKKQVIIASNRKAINKELKELINDLLDGNTQFKMIYNNSIGLYVDLRFNQSISKETNKIILSKHKNLFKKFNTK